MMSSESSIDLEFFCSPCGKSWSYHDINMAQAELANQWYQAHTHTPQEMRDYYATEDYATNVIEDDE